MVWYNRLIFLRTMERDTENRDISKEVIGTQISSPEFDSALSQIESHIFKVSEAVGKRAGEDVKPSGGGQDDKKVKPHVFANMSQRILELLGGGKSSKIVLPSKKIQQKEVVKALSLEVKRLVKETQRVQNARKFSPAKVEALLMKIRGLQKMISDVLYVATGTLSQWYEKYVIKKS